MRATTLFVTCGCLLIVACSLGGEGETQPGGAGGSFVGGGGSVAPGGSGGTGTAEGGSGGSGGVPVEPVRLASAVIGPDGGSITTPDGLVTLHVPFAALEAPLTITVDTTASPTPGAIGRVIELGPSGTTFAKPVSVVLAAAGSGIESNLRVATAEGGTWVPLAGHRYDQFAGRIWGETTHFSEFGLVEIETECASDADCDEGEICHQGFHTCSEPLSCDPDDFYPCFERGNRLEQCIEGTCLFVCQDRENCEGGLVDDDCNGIVDDGCPTCEDLGFDICGGACTDVTTDSSNCGACGNVCDNRSICWESVCERLSGDPCRADADCPEAQFCYEGYCERRPTPCDDDEDCGEGLACYEGFCY